ncbi:SIS domain-containing protein [Epidermidibacterium keratini]|uniref:SIS domain-containing protein n=1 Tax=Epidermidibacterium keratini TaxID=1891644 RepID=A0A7L4YM88_9ACTN|nr:SIS domain-containing protein [Epidermidibacterium keratini]QHC00395.1 SIS domain-containing protein [Epidermidibacterium keratini]
MDASHTGSAQHLDQLAGALSRFELGARQAYDWGRALAGELSLGRRLLVAGNGGSAAQAQHLTAELVGRYHRDRPAYSAICLSAETSSLTAIGNDYPPEELFARQVDAHGRAGDVLIALSTSGRSRNIVAAVHRAQSVGLRTWALTGRGPNPTADAAEQAICIDAADTATVQEIHLVALHLICEGFDDVVCPAVESAARGMANA